VLGLPEPDADGESPRATNTLILVHRSQLLEQWLVQLSAFLGILKRSIGRFGDGKRALTGLLDGGVPKYSQLGSRSESDFRRGLGIMRA